MAQLEIGEEKSKLLDEVETLALNVLKQYLSDEREGGDDIRVAQGVVATVAKNRQTASARDAIRFNMVLRTASEDELKDYVAKTVPIKRQLCDRPEEEKSA